MPKFEVYADAIQTVMTVVEAENEEEAVKKAKECPIDLQDYQQLQYGSSKDGWTFWDHTELEDFEAVGPFTD